MKHFVTLFPAAENIHLVKDVGQIPYHMQKEFGYRSTLVCYQNDKNYPYQKTQVDGLNIKFIEDRGDRFFWEKSPLRYIRQNAGAIDVLNLYHLTQASMLYGIIYKLWNPDGILYLKLDFNLRRYQQEAFHFSKSSWKERIYQSVFKWFVKFVDVVSIETQEARDLLSEKFAHKILHIPNGVAADAERHSIRFAQKENIILTVGRIGIPEKNHGLLLKALGKAKLEDWKVQFAGPVEASFQTEIDHFLKTNPTLKSAIEFVGPVYDREKLYNLYKRAKIFCLPSRSEGFPLAMVEALMFGNYIIGTDAITSIREVTNNGQLGQIVPSEDSTALARAIEKVTQPCFYDETMQNCILEHAQNYQWSRILKVLNFRLNEIWEKKLV